MPHDTGAITLLMLAAALAIGVLGISEQVQSQPTSHPHSQSTAETLYSAERQESQE